MGGEGAASKGEGEGRPSVGKGGWRPRKGESRLVGGGVVGVLGPTAHPGLPLEVV
jgi:hypothetical protein